MLNKKKDKDLIVYSTSNERSSISAAGFHDTDKCRLMKDNKYADC